MSDQFTPKIPTAAATKFRKFFLALFGLAIFLLLLNIILSFFTPKQKVNGTPGLTADQINSIFLQSVHDFSLSDNFLERIVPRKKNIDSTLIQYKLTLPYDVPIPVFLTSLNTFFEKENVEISATETQANKKTEVTIASGIDTTLRVVILQDTSIHRNVGKITFVLSDYEVLQKDELARLLNLPLHFALLVHARKDNIEFLPTIIEARKDYILALTETSPNSEFTLGENFPRDRNELAVKALVHFYPKNPYMVVDAGSLLLSSGKFAAVRKEFEARGCKLYSTGRFVDLSKEKENDCLQKINALGSKLEGNEIKIIMLRASLFLQQITKISDVKKRGVSFISPSQALASLTAHP